MADTRTLQQLAKESLDVQDACNLSGVVHGFSRSITRLRELLPNAGTDDINTHPICVIWADKIAHLTRTQMDSTKVLFDSYSKVKDLAEGKAQ